MQCLAIHDSQAKRYGGSEQVRWNRGSRNGRYMRRTMATVALTVLSGAFATAAQAGFNAQLQPSQPPPSVDAATGASPITQVGEGVAAAAPGFGRQLPLRQALRMLLPEEWSYVPTADGDSLIVSWTGSRTWLEALRQIGETYQVRFLVDWDHKIVYSDRLVKSSAPGPDAVRTGKTDTGSVQSPWELEAGGLRNQLARWADRAHYHLYWPQSIADVSIQVPAALSGDFLEAIKQISAALQAVGTGLKLHVYEMNQALVVEEF